MQHAIDRGRDLASRLRQIRRDRFGDSAAGMAGLLGLPPGTWSNYERGVAMPAEVLLEVIEATGVDPHWLATGRGGRYGRSVANLSPPGWN